MQFNSAFNDFGDGDLRRMSLGVGVIQVDSYLEDLIQIDSYLKDRNSIER